MADVFKLTTIAGTELFRVDDSGNVTAAGTISTTGTDDFGALGIKADIIAESTSAAGVTVDGLLLKDGFVVAIDNQGWKLGTGVDDTCAHNGTLTTWTHTTGNLIVDNTAVTGSTYMDLGTDTTATSFGVRNNSGTAKFEVKGDGSVWVNGGTLDMSTGASDIFVPDNNATALRIREKTNSRDYIIVKTSNGTEAIQFGDAAVNPVYQFLGTGAATFGGTLTATGGITGTALAADESVVATVACADATGGGTTALLSVTLKQRDNSTAISSARQVILCASSTQYLLDAGPGNASLSLGTVTAGSIISTPIAGGLWLVETDAAGLFACTATNTDDETVYFSAQTAQGGVSDVTKRCLVLGSNSDSAAWSA